MSIKHLLGMGLSHMSDEEIMEKIMDARLHHQEEVIFWCEKKKISVHLVKVSPEGMMRGYESYYSAK